jgi:hypothetical protein
MEQLAHALRRRGGNAMAELDRLTGEVATLARRTVREVEVVARNARRALGRRYLEVPGRLTASARRPTLHLPAARPWQWRWEVALARLRCIPPLDLTGRAFGRLGVVPFGPHGAERQPARTTIPSTSTGTTWRGGTHHRRCQCPCQPFPARLAVQTREIAAHNQIIYESG